MNDKELKKWFKEECKKNPEKHYPVKFLKSRGFKRGKCEKCGTNFWSKKDRKVCGDSLCEGGFTFIGDTPATNRMDYVEAWQAFASTMKKFGYTPIDRYPVVARWNPTTDFTIASIAAFQPYVVSGEIEPPANPLVIPQFCLRFGDVDNVGVTGAHYTGFVMMGQHTFVPPKEYDPDKYLEHIYTWITEGIGIPEDEITFHEDAWAGGGNFGPSMEYFSRGLELGNQVYMQYEHTPEGNKELKIKVLDMGAGLERVPWFTQGTFNSYETTFPTVMKNLRKHTGLDVDEDLMKAFLPYANFLNVDETEDVQKAWQEIAAKINYNVEELKKKVLPQAALASIADHTRSLLFAITDGGLPSNVGGMYNLRVILRRALSLINKYGWDIRLQQVCQWHAEYLKPIFPELLEKLDNVNTIIDVEERKYQATLDKSKQILAKLKSKEITTETLLELYDSNGISPEMVQEATEKRIKVPDNFYQLVAERHEQAEAKQEKEMHIELPEIEETKALYYDDYKLCEFKAEVMAVSNKYVVLDRSAFYPTSGGQIHDIGTIEGNQVVDVFKQGNVIVHTMAEKPKFKEGDKVTGRIDQKRRMQLARHHTATHIVNAAAKRILGPHINQAGAKKDVTKAHIDLTHYENPDEDEMHKIEKEANDIIKKAIPIKKEFLPRAEAEKEYGMRIYQGGAVPGKQLRIVCISDLDVEACGGTHVDNTKEVVVIKLVKVNKIQDGVIRITFTAGDAAKEMEAGAQEQLEEIAQELKCKAEQVPGRVQELFSLWKKARKAKKKDKGVPPLKLESKEESPGSAEDILGAASTLVQTQPEYLLNTVKRFKKEIQQWSE